MIREKVMTILRDTMHLDVPSPDTDLVEAGLMDSLGLVDLLMQLEQNFGLVVSLDDLEVDHLRSASRIGAFVTEQIAA